MDLYDTIFSFIDMRSFSNLWYWIALAVLWSSTSHWVLGVPYDMIQRGRREGGQAQQDLEDIVRINAGRVLNTVDRGAVWIVGLGCFWLSILAILGFFYDIEFAKAVFFLAAPMTLIGWLTVKSCVKVTSGDSTGALLHRRLTIHRRIVQTLGMLSILVTAMYGMWQNITVSILN